MLDFEAVGSCREVDRGASPQRAPGARRRAQSWSPDARLDLRSAACGAAPGCRAPSSTRVTMRLSTRSVNESACRPVISARCSELFEIQFHTYFMRTSQRRGCSGVDHVYGMPSIAVLPDRSLWANSGALRARRRGAGSRSSTPRDADGSVIGTKGREGDGPKETGSVPLRCRGRRSLQPVARRAGAKALAITNHMSSVYSPTEGLDARTQDDRPTQIYASLRAPT